LFIAVQILRELVVTMWKCTRRYAIISYNLC